MSSSRYCARLAIVLENMLFSDYKVEIQFYKSKKFETSSMSLQTGIAKYVSSPSAKNYAKALGAVSTYINWLTKNGLLGSFILVNPFEEKPPQDPLSILTAIKELHIEDLPASFEGAFIISQIVNLAQQMQSFSASPNPED